MLRSQFDRDGYLGPLPFFSPEECRYIADYLVRDERPAPATWYKGRGVHERFLYDLAVRPSIIDRVGTLLGDDVVLWGVCDVRRRPGQVHPWHSDIESCAPEGGFVSVWIGIHNTTRQSSLQMIRGSHRLCRTVQEARADHGIERDQARPDLLLDVVRREMPEAELIIPDMVDGQGIVFDGRLWHGTDNGNREGERVALLLQYAAAHRSIRIPDLNQLDWPFRFVGEPRPPVILVRGSDGTGPNRVVPPPPSTSRGRSMLETAIHTFDFLTPTGQPEKPWRAYPAFRGPTRGLADMACHASVLQAGHQPHPPHAHVEEEVLIPLAGEVEVTIAASESDPAPRVERLRPGTFIYYPAWQYHTIRNPGTEPVSYLMLKWKAPVEPVENPLPVQVVQFEAEGPSTESPPFWTHGLLEGPTDSLGKFHAHLSVLAPAAGYDPHRDAYDVAIVTLGGCVETLGQRVGPGSVVYYGTGELHGMRNVGGEAARYLVFEFHRPGAHPIPRPVPLPKRIKRRAGKVLRPVLDRLRKSPREPS